MKICYIPLPTIAAFMPYADAASSQTAPAMKADGILVSTAGMTLYIFDQDVQDSG
nr:hypothetical protein [Collimonas humicola]